MIILSQDKKTILNFNNIQDIKIETYGTHEKGVKVYKIFAGNFEGYATELGKYKTEERAKEVLNEIMGNYKNWEYTKMGKLIIGKVVCDAIYEMPKE